jgi:hypothetical protein
MFPSLRSLAISLALLVASPLAFSEQVRVIRVGVPEMKNSANRSVPSDLERDRLVRALNDEKTGKKLHLKVQGVPLNGTDPLDVISQAQAKNCDYIVFTKLLELRTQGDPAERRPGSININPNVQWGTSDPESAAMNPEFDATVEYKLYRTSDTVPISGAPYNVHEAMSDIEVVSQVMNTIANRVFGDIKKGTPSSR